MSEQCMCGATDCPACYPAVVGNICDGLMSQRGEMIDNELRDPSVECLEWIADCHSHEYDKLVELTCELMRYQTGLLADQTRAKITALLRPQIVGYVDSWLKKESHYLQRGD